MRLTRHIRSDQVVATQAILDTRILAAELRDHGLGSAAASAFEARVLPMANRVTLGNRGNGGPDAIMQIAEDRCKGDFTVLDRALPYDERAAHSASFKKLAGLSLEADKQRTRSFVSLEIASYVVGQENGVLEVELIEEAPPHPTCRGYPCLGR